MPTANFKVGEMLPKRTPNSKTWMNFDGSYTTEIHSGIVHFEDQHGNLQNINTDLYDEADFDLIDEPVAAEGAERFKQAKMEAKAAKKQNVMNRSQHNFQALRVPFDAHIPRNFQRGYTIGKGQDKLTFKPVKSSPSMGELSQTNRSIIVYQDVWNDTDVELQVQPDGLKETIHLKTSKAPTSFSFEVKGKDIADDFTAGALKLMPAWLVDAAGTERDVEQVVVRGNDNKIYVELKADVTDLTYPIAIDPTVIVQPDGIKGKDATISTNAPNTNNGNSNVLVAGFDYIGGSTPATYRSLISFDLSAIPAGAYVSEGKMSFYIYSAEASSFQKFFAHEVLGNWSEDTVTWNNQPGFSAAALPNTEIYKHNTSGFWADMNLTTITNDWVNGVKENYGVLLKREVENTAENYWYAYSSNHGTVSQRPKMSITYNQPPTTPTVTMPNGGESWNAEHTISWQASSDAEGDTIVYEGQLSVDNGATWKTIFTNVSTINKTYDFTPEPETATALIRIRGFDGSSYSEWDQSSGVFTIAHNQAPDAPMNLLPSGGQSKDRAQPIRLSWLHNDPDAGDPQSKYDLQWRKQGATTWTSVTSVTPNQYHDLSGLTYGNHEWRVRTYDQAGLPSAYSDIALFLAADKPSKATITNYSEGATVAVANPTIQWSSADQAGFKLAVKNSTGTVVWSEEKVSANKALTANANLANQQAYTIELSIRNADGLWSDVTAIGVNVSYTPPAVPIQFRDESQPSVVVLSIENPVPTGTEPIVASNEVYRKKVGETDWLRIGKELLQNGTFTDYTPVPNKRYEYKVRAWGENGTYRDSVIATNSTTLEHAELALISNFEERVQLEYNTDTSQDKEYRRTLTQFAGRKYAMAEFSPEERLTLATDYILKTREELERFYDMADKKETLLYRDREGRHAYITIGSVAEKEIGFGQFFGISFNMDRVYVREGV